MRFRDDIFVVAEYKGWDKATQERKWLEIFNQFMFVIQDKRRADPLNRSSVRVMCNGRRPDDPREAGAPEVSCAVSTSRPLGHGPAHTRTHLPALHLA